jgi:membrane protein
MVTIENSCNIICRAPEGRSWTRRVPIYWTVLTFGPLAIAMTMYFTSRFEGWMQGSQIWTPLLTAAASLWSFAVLWLVLFALYKLVPNTNVSTRPALIGACIAALLVELGKRTLDAYFQNAVSFSQLLGSLGLVPIFMFWMYLMWLIVLFGLEVGNTLQMLGGRRLEEMEHARRAPGLVDPASVLVIMEFVAGRFAHARPTTPREIADHAGLPEATVQNLLDRLGEADFVNRLDREDGAVCLARPPDQITADQLIEIGFHLVDEGAGERSSLLDQLRDAQRSLAAESTLATLVARS